VPAAGLQAPQLLGGHAPPERPKRAPPRRRQRLDVDPIGAELEQPPVAVDLGEQLAHAGARGAATQAGQLAALTTGIQEPVEVVAARRRQLVGQQPLDLAMRLGAGGSDHASMASSSSRSLVRLDAPSCFARKQA
jgi:hypothetical protein